MGSLGMVIPPEDPIGLAKQIEQLYENRDRLAALGRQGRQYAVENFTFGQALNRYEALFEGLVADNTEKRKRFGLARAETEVLPK